MSKKQQATNESKPEAPKPRLLFRPTAQETVDAAKGEMAKQGNEKVEEGDVQS